MHRFSASVISCFFSLFSTHLAPANNHALMLFSSLLAPDRRGKIRAGQVQEKRQVLKHFFCLSAGFMWLAFRRWWKEVFLRHSRESRRICSITGSQFYWTAAEAGCDTDCEASMFLSWIQPFQVLPLGEICICVICFQQWGEKKRERLLGAWQKHKGPRG